LEDFLTLSSKLSEDVPIYRHAPYQAAVTAIAASKGKSFVIVTLPTGSGKTWVQGLLARHYCEQAKRVAILEPNETLLL
jgi:superfamily II DNA or RNA helicase